MIDNLNNIMTSISIDSTQAQAHKRRREILASRKTSKRQKSEDDAAPVEVSSTKDRLSSTTSRRKKTITTYKAKVIKSDTKYQNRYEPEEPMSKEDEAVWRKEARRLRNRESAANSRNKVRNRIEELETEVEDWKTKYASLMKRIGMLEKGLPPSCPLSSTCVSPLSSTCVTPKTIYVPTCVSTNSEEDFDLCIPLISDCASSITSDSSLFTTRQETIQPIIEQDVTSDEDHHVIEITSRPAVSRL